MKAFEQNKLYIQKKQNRFGYCVFILRTVRDKSIHTMYATSVYTDNEKPDKNLVNRVLISN